MSRSEFSAASFLSSVEFVLRRPSTVVLFVVARVGTLLRSWPEITDSLRCAAAASLDAVAAVSSSRFYFFPAQIDDDGAGDEGLAFRSHYSSHSPRSSREILV